MPAISPDFLPVVYTTANAQDTLYVSVAKGCSDRTHRYSGAEVSKESILYSLLERAISDAMFERRAELS